MSVEAIALVLHHSQAKGTDKLVLVGIANHHGDGGAWPSIATLATYANATERTVQRSIARLVEMGELVRHLQEGGLVGWEDHFRPNRYDVVISCPPWCDRSMNHRDTRPRRPVDNPSPEGVTPTSPPDADVTPPPDAGVTRTVQGTHDDLVERSTTDRARPDLDEVREQLRRDAAETRRRLEGRS